MDDDDYDDSDDDDDNCDGDVDDELKTSRKEHIFEISDICVSNTPQQLSEDRPPSRQD